jgi:hypothetical protein
MMVTTVTELNISHNKLQAIPLEYANMRSLKIFEVIENPWAMIPEEAIRQNLQIMYMFRVADTSRAGFLILRGFNISSGGLFALRVALPSVESLKDINLEENKITDIPSYFSAATQLQTLDIGGCKQITDDGLVLARHIPAADAWGDGLKFFSPDGDYLASAGADRWVLVWSCADGALVRAYQGPAAAFDVGFSASGGRLAAAFANGATAVIDLRR